MNRYFPRPDACISIPSRTRIAVDRRELTGFGMPRGMKLLFASDLHLRPDMDADMILQVINDCEADLVLLGGDYADTRDQALRLFHAFRSLRAPMGVFAIRGNNDAEAFDSPDALRKVLEKCNITLLLNESTTLGRDGMQFSLGGVDDYKHGQPDYARVFSPADSQDMRILLSHHPILPDAPDAQMPDLMLSGHTHGGQFNALGLTPYAVGYERLGRHKASPALVSGMRRFGRTTLLTSKGIGTSKLPLRIGVRQEIHLLTFG